MNASSPVSSVGHGARVVDREVVDDRLHRERQGRLQLAFGRLHDRGDRLLRLALAVRGEDEPHAAARHAAEHQEAPEIVGEVGTRLFDQGLGVVVARPGDDRLDRPAEVGQRVGGHAAQVAAAELAPRCGR